MNCIACGKEIDSYYNNYKYEYCRATSRTRQEWIKHILAYKTDIFINAEIKHSTLYLKEANITREEINKYLLLR